MTSCCRDSFRLLSAISTVIVSLTGVCECRVVLIEPDITGTSIVLVGNFNPAILSPDWFVRQDLFRDAEVNRTDPEYIVHPQLTQFKLDWCQIVVEPSRFTISSTRDPFVRLADLVANTFGGFLPHTPISQFGITRHVHFRVASIEVRDAIGFKLAPPEVWGEWGAKIKAQRDAIRGGLRSLTMIQRVFDTDRSGFISATVEPSNQLPKGVGVFVKVNDEHSVTVGDAQEAMVLLASCFDASQKNAEDIVDHVMRLARDAA